MTQLKIVLIWQTVQDLSSAEHGMRHLCWELQAWTKSNNDEGTIAFKSRLICVQCLLAKPIKKGSKVWMYCDADTAYLHQFEVYLGQQQNSEFGLGYNVVMKLCKDISTKITISLITNLFVSGQLLKD